MCPCRLWVNTRWRCCRGTQMKLGNVNTCTNGSTREWDWKRHFCAFLLCGVAVRGWELCRWLADSSIMACCATNQCRAARLLCAPGPRDVVLLVAARFTAAVLRQQRTNFSDFSVSSPSSSRCDALFADVSTTLPRLSRSVWLPSPR